MQYANRGATLSIRLNRRVKRKFLAEELLDQGKCGVEEKFNYPASRNRFAKDNPWKNSALRTRGKIQLRKYFNFIPRPLDAARRQELFHALSPSPDLFDARNPPLEFPPHPFFSLSFSFISFDGSRSFDTRCTCRARVDACWRLEDSSANARIRIGPCSERKRGVTHARINRPVAFQDPSSRIVSRWPQGLKEEGVGQRCWNKKRDYIVRLQGCNFSVIRFPPFWFVLVCFTSELIIVIGILEGGEERRGGWMEDRWG